MRCLECSQAMTNWSLLVAMEQREHFAMVRHAEVCASCALRMYPAFERLGVSSRYWHQTLDCAYCGNKMPIVRFRFEVKDRINKYFAMCDKCYIVIGKSVVPYAPNTITFIEKEWLTLQGKQKRMPWSNGTPVKIMAKTPRFFGKTGTTQSFRCLAHPWYGYDVSLPDGSHHFFHERDLQPVDNSIPAPPDCVVHTAHH